MDKWKKLEESLRGVFASATVLAGGHEVKMQKRISGEKLVIEVGVDGWVKGAWMFVDDKGQPKHPEGRFYRPMRSRAWPLKQHKSLKKVFGKKEADRMTELRTMALSPYWNSPRSLISHLKKHFPDLEIKEPEEAAK